MGTLGNGPRWDGRNAGTSPTARRAVSFVLPRRDLEHWHLLSLVFRLQMGRRRQLHFWIKSSGKGESEFCLPEWALEPGALACWWSFLMGRLPGPDLLLSCFLSDSPAAAPKWPGPLPHCLLLSGVFRVCHCHWDHTVQQVAGTEPKAFLLSPSAATPTVAVSVRCGRNRRWPDHTAQWSSPFSSSWSGTMFCHWSFEFRDTVFPWSSVRTSDSGSGSPPTAGQCCCDVPFPAVRPLGAQRVEIGSPGMMPRSQKRTS